jgi:hypothetical protein
MLSNHTHHVPNMACLHGDVNICLPMDLSSYHEDFGGTRNPVYYTMSISFLYMYCVYIICIYIQTQCRMVLSC